MQQNLTQTIEDYLKVIFDITLKEERASTNQIAEALGVTPASVTGMVQRLSNSQPPLLDYQKHHGVKLTEAGQHIALEVVRHHRLLEMYLHQALGYGWDEVHAEADRLEHVISEEFEERIATALGNPSHDPHGDPIPSRDLRMPSTPSTQLANLRPGQRAIVQRVRNADLKLLRYLSQIGLVPMAHLTVLEYSPFDDNLKISIENQESPVILGPRITSQVFVDLIT
jgi:DtxR family Mn-dependent transcriptional regulator